MQLSMTTYAGRSQHHKAIGRLLRSAALIVLTASFLPTANAMPSFARQTGQKCAACHVGGNWPQLTPWGRFFKLSGYTAGNAFIDKEGFNYVPLGLLGQVGLTISPKPNDAQGQPVVDHNGAPQAYDFTGEFGTKLTDHAGIFYQYGVGNTFPGWKGGSGPIDIRATHFFQIGGKELLLGVDSNNDPSLQDVWNSIPSWSYPFYGSPQAPGAPAGPMMTSLAQQSGSIGAYALFDRQFYAELSMYHVGNGFFRWMNARSSYASGAQYLKGFKPYWRAYWTTERRSAVWMVGTFGMLSEIYPDSGSPRGATDSFADTGFDSQYQHLGETRKLTVRASYVYEQQSWNGSFPQGGVSNPKGNLKTVNLSSSLALRDAWTFTGGYFFSNGSNNAALYGISDANGNPLTAKPNTSGYEFEVDRTLTQNVIAMVQYAGFTKFNGLTSNIDGLG